MNHFQLAKQIKSRLERVFPVRPSHIVQIAAGSQFEIYDGDTVLVVTVTCKEGCHYD